jgi:hypothetical protein
MKFKVKLFDAKGQELEIENNVIGDILFECEQAFDFFINAIKSSLPSNFQYKVIPEKEVHKNNSVRNRKDSSIFQK